MNRENLFRGKRLDNGEWVYGSLVQMLVDGRIATFICPAEEVGRGNKDVPPMGILYTLNKDIFLVDPATVGQFTGAIDKNGNKIFEGDIFCPILNRPYFIFWDKEKAGFALTNNQGYCLNYYPNNTSEDTIIGNIHDNPELLKGGEK